MEIRGESFTNVEEEIPVETVGGDFIARKAIKREREEFLNDSRQGRNSVKTEMVEYGDAGDVVVFNGSKKKSCSPVRQAKLKRSEFSDAGHRRRLMRLLVNFVRVQNWKPASHVLCTLLAGTDQSGHPTENRKKYWAAMEILSQIENESIYPLKIKRMYEVWMSKNRLRTKQSMKRKYLIQLEYVLFLLSLGNISEAHSSIKFLVLDSESGSDPLVNMVAGLISYQLWYLGISKEMQCMASTIQTQSGFKECEFHHGLNVNPENVEYSVNSDTMKTQETQTLDQHLSDGSVCNKRMNSIDVCNNVPAHQILSADGFYMKECGNASENSASLSSCDRIHGSIPFPYGLDISLLPIQIPLSTNNLDSYYHLCEEANKKHYLNAVKYLRVALYSNPPMLPALVPLVQIKG